MRSTKIKLLIIFAIIICVVIVTVVISINNKDSQVFQTWSVYQVLNAFKTAGLEIGSVYKYPVYGRSYAGSKEAIHFLLPSLCADCGGRIFVFDSKRAMNKTEKQYSNLTPMTWLFIRDNVIVQINGDYPEEKARKYEEVLNNLEKWQTPAKSNIDIAVRETMEGLDFKAGTVYPTHTPEPTSTPIPSPTPYRKPNTFENPLKLNTPISDSVINLVVRNDNIKQQICLFSDCEKADLYVNIEATCNLIEPNPCRLYPDYYFDVIGKKGLKYESNLYNSTQFIKGAIITEELKFIVDKDDSDFVLIFSNGNIWSGKETIAYIDLGN
jgi:hypothetical protein